MCHGENGDLFSRGEPAQRRIQARCFGQGSQGRSARDGVPGTAMVAGAYEDAELVALVAYLRNMDADVGGVELGDAARGQALFEGRGDCGSCHRIAGQGPRFAPDLTHIGAIRTAATLSRALEDPHGSTLPMNRAVRVVLADGTAIIGRRLNEDTYTVQLIDEQERLLSLDKAELSEYTILTTWDLPSYADRFLRGGSGGCTGLPPFVEGDQLMSRITLLFAVGPPGSTGAGKLRAAAERCRGASQLVDLLRHLREHPIQPAGSDHARQRG